MRTKPPTHCGILTEVTVALLHARSTDIRPARGGSDFQSYCDVFSICNLQSLWFAGCLRWSTGLLFSCFPVAPTHARRLASGVDCQLCSFSVFLCRSSRTVTAKPCDTYYRFWRWCWLRSRMGLAFDLAHHLARQNYLARRVASASVDIRRATSGITRTTDIARPAGLVRFVPEAEGSRYVDCPFDP
jgi:hypothetical protein